MNNKVLVADDEKKMRALFVKLLERQGFGVLATDRGSEAIRITRDERPKVVILDIKMPEMNGLEVLERIRKENSAVRVIIVTGYPSVKVSKKAERFGVDGIILKPFNVVKAIQAIKKALLNYNKNQMASILKEKHQICPWGQSSCLFCEKEDCPLIKEA